MPLYSGIGCFAKELRRCGHSGTVCPVFRNRKAPFPGSLPRMFQPHHGMPMSTCRAAQQEVVEHSALLHVTDSGIAPAGIPGNCCGDTGYTCVPPMACSNEPLVACRPTRCATYPGMPQARNEPTGDSPLVHIRGWWPPTPCDLSRPHKRSDRYSPVCLEGLPGCSCRLSHLSGLQAWFDRISLPARQPSMPRRSRVNGAFKALVRGWAHVAAEALQKPPLTQPYRA